MKLLPAWLALAALAVAVPQSHAGEAAPAVDGDRMQRTMESESGFEAAQGQYPFVVSLQWRTTPRERPQHICAGSLLSPVVVMTTAQCLADRIKAANEGSHLTLVIDRADLDDTSQGVERRPLRRSDGTARIFLHPAFTGAGSHDVAVIQLDEPVTVDVRPRLPAGGATGLPAGDWMTAGWAAGTPRLQRAQAPLLQDDPCRRKHGDVFDSATHLCAGGDAGRISCADEGGSPLFISNRDERRPLQAGMAIRYPGCGGASPQVYLRLDEPEVRAFLSRFVPLF